MKKKVNNRPADKYDRYCKVDLQVGLNAIRAWMVAPRDRSIRGKVRVPINGMPVNLQSLRLFTFVEKGTICKHCRLAASHFAIERSATDAGYPASERPYHLNLWGIDPSSGEEILFTHDHTHQRSTGGKDKLENTETMCTICNAEKSIEEGRLAAALANELGRV